MELGNKSQNLNNPGSFQISIMNHTSEKVHKCKFLGVYVNDKLNWNDHLLCKKQMYTVHCTLYTVQMSEVVGILDSILRSIVPKNNVKYILKF